MDPNKYWDYFEKPSDIWFDFVTAACILISVLGLVFNILVIIFLVRFKGFRVTSNRYYLLNLAVSDILKVSVNIPLKALSSLHHQWLFGVYGCQFYGFIGGLSGFSSITILTFMAIDRYFMLRNPLNILKDRSVSISKCIILAWIYSIGLISLQFLTKHKFVIEGIQTSCTFDYLSRDTMSRGVVTVMFIAGFFLPFVLIFIFYALIVRLLKSPNCSDSIEIQSSFVSSPSMLLSKMVVRRELRVIRQIVVCFTLFCFTWFPYAIVVLVAQFASDEQRMRFVTPLTATLPALFAKTSAVINPILYTLTNQDCKTYLRSFFRKSSRSITLA